MEVRQVLQFFDTLTFYKLIQTLDFSLIKVISLIKFNWGLGAAAQWQSACLAWESVWVWSLLTPSPKNKTKQRKRFIEI
jgi:hypothetical protein